MTLKKFREQTKDMDESVELFVGERTTDFAYGLVNSVQLKEINFQEDPQSKPLAKATVLVISEE